MVTDGQLLAATAQQPAFTPRGNCHAHANRPSGGVNLCTLLLGHRGNHLDTVFNRSFKA